MGYEVTEDELACKMMIDLMSGNDFIKRSSALVTYDTP